jgi:hypothetical protein
MGNASFIIAPQSETPNLPMLISETSLPITSLTHPDQDAWYESSNAMLTWEINNETSGVSFVLDKIADTEPGNKSDGLLEKKEYQGLADGIWYFHLKLKEKDWGQASHYRLQIDSRPPFTFAITIDQDDLNDWPTLIFKAEDEFSGIDKYQIMIDNLAQEGETITADVGKYKAVGLEAGNHIALVRAIDKAGNETIATVQFSIKPSAPPVIKNYSREIRAGDKFYASGTSGENQTVTVYLQAEGEKIINKTTNSDAAGNWILIGDEQLSQGRFIFWAEASNANGLKSEASAKETFLVAPSTFSKIASFINQYFTVFVSLLFLSILVIVLIVYLFDLIRRKLKKETIEVETVLHQALEHLKKNIEQEFVQLEKFENSPEYRKEKLRSKLRLKQKIEFLEKGILKEVKDVEKLLK